MGKSHIGAASTLYGLCWRDSHNISVLLHLSFVIARFEGYRSCHMAINRIGYICMLCMGTASRSHTLPLGNAHPKCIAYTCSLTREE